MLYLQATSLLAPLAEFLLLLLVATLIGWQLARSIMKGQINSIQNTIDERQMQIEACRKEMDHEKSGNNALVGIASKTVYPIFTSKSAKPDDLKIIEGIGPKIEEILNIEGIKTYASLSETTPMRLSSILKKAGPRYQIHDPSTWPQQAKLAQFSKWDDLEILKNSLIGGKERSE
jgi:predicted flap endonuclease-1-like 5' DNA nuclease